MTSKELYGQADPLWLPPIANLAGLFLAWIFLRFGGPWLMAASAFFFAVVLNVIAIMAGKSFSHHRRNLRYTFLGSVFLIVLIVWPRSLDEITQEGGPSGLFSALGTVGESVADDDGKGGWYRLREKYWLVIHTKRGTPRSGHVWVLMYPLGHNSFLHVYEVFRID